MKLNDFIEDVHVNAVAHGWWEDERPYAEVLALIHSEWSEALEEYRAGRPMVWHGCAANGYPVHPCELCEDCAEKETKAAAECEDFCNKPEGIAVELADGVIRIFDYFGNKGMRYEDDMNVDDVIESIPDDVKESILRATFPDFINTLHMMTVYAVTPFGEGMIHHFNAISAVLFYIRSQGLDPMEILMEKHLYNKTRPYKHGKVC